MVSNNRRRVGWGLVALLAGALTVLAVVWIYTTVLSSGDGRADLNATVVKVVDGDTVHVSTPSGPEVVRVLGIDTPETRKPLVGVQCGGPEATDYAREMLTDQRVLLIADPSQADRDRYRRLLRYIQLADGRDYSVEAARAGIARSYVYGKKPVQEQAQIKAAEAEARDAHRGLWGRCTG